MTGEAVETGLLLVLLLNAASTLYLVGLNWLVQWVHYPLFAGVGEKEFAAYERAHVARITPVVAPAMLIEAKTALVLALFPPAAIAPLLSWLGLAAVVAIWLSTFLLQVPQHEELRSGFDARSHDRLVRTNWIRTILWSLRGALVLCMLFGAMSRAAQ